MTLLSFENTDPVDINTLLTDPLPGVPRTISGAVIATALANTPGTFYAQINNFNVLQNAIVNNRDRLTALKQEALGLSPNSDKYKSIQEQIDNIVSYSALLPSLEGLQNAVRRSGAEYMNKFGVVGTDGVAGSIDQLIEKYNPYIYNSNKFFGLVSDTRFKIGPLTYGGEVQDIRIIEDKALVSVAAVRSDTDLLVDGGIADADVEVTLLFSGEEHIMAGLRPLIALFKLSPITSVQNDTIDAALYDKFTENADFAPKEELIEAVDNILSASVVNDTFQQFYKEVEATGKLGSLANFEALDNKLIKDANNSLWQELQNSGIEGLSDYETYNLWKENVVRSAQSTGFSESRPLAGDIETASTGDNSKSKINEETGDSDLYTSDKIDKTGHVPMAMVGLNMQVNPDMVDTIIVTLYLKRISVRNYLTEFLRYRDINGNPTPDARRAFWLNRAMQMYIDTYLDKSWVSASLKTTELAYYGDNIELVWFMNGENLTKLKFSGPPKPTDNLDKTDDLTGGIVVNSLNNFMANKFAFHRLIGEAYPTAQYMGQTSGSLTMQLTANGDKVLEKIHTYKNAADFFSRHIDRLTRMNGWLVDCILTRLTNKSKDRVATLGANGVTATNQPLGVPTFFPKNIATAVNASSPGLRDVNISFLQTDPDWFANFGFSIKQGSYDLDKLWNFTKVLFEEADKVKNGSSETGWFSASAFKTIYGNNSSPLIKTNFLNADTLVAGLLAEKTISESGTEFVKSYPEGFRQIQLDIAQTLLGDEFFSGIPKTRDLSIWEVTKLYFSGLTEGYSGRSFSDMGEPGSEKKLAERIAEAIISDFSRLSDARQASLINAIDRLPTYEGRHAFYNIVRSYPDVILQEHYKQRIFSAVMRRKDPPFDGIYYSEGINLAFDALITMFVYSGSSTTEELAEDTKDKDAKNKAHTYSSAMSKSIALHERKINIDGEGRIDRSMSPATAYPDYPYFSFQQLFDMPDEGIINNWTNYAYSYQDMGIMNNNPDSYPKGENRFDVDAFAKAQKEKINFPESPVPPSIFFYRKPELSNAYNDLNSEMDDYFDQLSGLTLNLPYDVETAVRDKEGNIAGQTEISEFVLAANQGRIDLNDPRHRQWSTQIESYGERIASYYGKQAMQDQFDQIGQAVLRQLQDEWNNGEGMSDEEWVEMIRDKNAGYRTLQQKFYDVTNWSKALSNDGRGVNVPLLMYSHKDSPVVKYKHMSGARGQAVLKSLIDAHLEQSGLEGDDGRNLLDEYLNEQISQNAAGLVSAPSISCGNNQEIKAAMTKILQSTADNKNDLIKAFPTFRLYFIEFQSPHIIVQDTMIGYNAVQSIDVTLDKNDADLAVIRLADPFGFLQGTGGQFADIPLAATNDKNADGEQVFTNATDKAGKSFFERTQLKQGKAIQIRGGYSAEVDNLDILFTGRVVEIQFGDIITIVAQGWKTDFIGQQVNFELNRPENTSVKDLVVKTIRAVNPSGIGVVMSEQEIGFLNTFVGGLAGLEEYNQAWSQHVGTSASGDKGAAAGMTGYGPWKFNQGLGRGLDMRLKNIWVPDRDSNTRFGWWGDITSTGWDAERWVVPLQPGWDVLENATNYCWGYICQVVPYDGEATLFFGRPDQMYFYTRGNHREAKLYRTQGRISAKAQKSRFIELFESWAKSRYYEVYPSIRTASSEGGGLADQYTYKGPSPGFSDNPDTYNPFTDTLTRKNEWTKSRLVLPPDDRGFTDFRRWLYYDADHISNWAKVNPFGASSDDTSARHDRRAVEIDVTNDWQVIQSIFGRETASVFVLGVYAGLDPDFLRQAWPFKKSLIVDKMCAPQYGEQNLLDGVHNSWQGYMLEDLKQFLLNLIPASSEGYTLPEDHPLYSTSAEQLLEYSNTLRAFTPENVTIIRTQSINPGQAYDTKDTYATPSTFNYGYDVKFSNMELKEAREALSAMNIAVRIATFRPKENALATFQQKVRSMNQEVAQLNIPVTFIEQQHEATWGAYNLKNLGNLQSLASILDDAANAVKQGFVNTEFTVQGRSGEWMELSSKIHGAPRESKFVAESMATLFGVANFKGFIHYFAKWLNSQDLTKEDKELIGEISKNEVFEWPAAINMKVFRDYHYIQSERDIIENNIAASTREMFNSVVVHYPKELNTSNDGIIRSIKEHATYKNASSDYNEVFIDSGTSWTTFPDSSKQDGIAGMQFNDQVSLANKKVAVHTDPSLTRPDQAAKVATNVLTKAMRPMYRNNLLLTGRAIKPWDVIHLKDKYTDMSGPLDVERVVHHYNATSGWVTNIIPHAYCEANPGNKYVQTAVFANRMNQIMDVVDWTINAITIITALPTLGASIELGLAARATVGFAARRTAKEMGKMAGKDMVRKKVFLTSLRRGARYAGLNGAKKHFMKTLSTNGAKALNRYFIGQLGSYGVGEFTDIYMTHMGAGEQNLPVVFAPLIFKGVPLTSGMEANEYGMWSVGSKAFWSMRNGIEGLTSMLNSLGSDVGSQEAGIMQNITQGMTPRNN